MLTQPLQKLFSIGTNTNIAIQNSTIQRTKRNFYLISWSYQLIRVNQCLIHVKNNRFSTYIYHYSIPGVYAGILESAGLGFTKLQALLKVLKVMIDKWTFNNASVINLFFFPKHSTKYGTNFFSVSVEKSFIVESDGLKFSLS